MSQRILFVDDEPNVLSGLKRLLRKEYEFDTAEGGVAGLDKLQEETYAVVVSDMRMPGMSGEEFLAKAHVEQPDAVQMILSGQANLESTVAAVNDGNIFRFLVKPVEKPTLTAALDRALRQYNLINAERELLDRTLSGAVAALTEVINLVSPAASRRTGHVVEVVKHLAPAVGLEGDWQLRIASLLSGIGFAATPTEVVERATLGQELTPAESQMLERFPEVATQLLGPIPRLEGVSAIIRAQAGVERPADDLTTHVDVLSVAITAAEGIARSRSIDDIVAELTSNGSHEPELLERLRTMQISGAGTVEERRLRQLLVGMTLAQDVSTIAGVMLASSGTVLTESLLERIRNFASSTGVEEPILVTTAAAGR